jgi:hypothetical protein
MPPEIIGATDLDKLTADTISRPFLNACATDENLFESEGGSALCREWRSRERSSIGQSFHRRRQQVSSKRNRPGRR